MIAVRFPRFTCSDFASSPKKQALACPLARDRVTEFIEAFDERRAGAGGGNETFLKNIDDDGNETEELEEAKVESEAPPLKRPAKVHRGGASRAALEEWDDAVGKLVSKVSSGVESVLADCLSDIEANGSQSAKGSGIEAPK